uniref:Uncharacterized protein n=1 Tax=Candidatus Kentrum sp. FW TaxID=2126338 RepID=A0A450T122_9GAMM|nr:MAG: hypothetical protein BECKFW1821A_GA0114235_10994 [Candidatus Kentron sp. FW]
MQMGIPTSSVRRRATKWHIRYWNPLPAMRYCQGNRHRGRPITSLPTPVLFLLAIGLILQIVWHGALTPPPMDTQSLPTPSSEATLRLASLGDPLPVARLLMLWLQAFDNQAGIQIPFHSLDYHKVRQWLTRILALDPDGQYPLLAASRLYTQVPDQDKQRLMLAFVHKEFLKDPNHRWPWLAHGVILAKYHLKDLPLALKYAWALTRHAIGPQVPYQVRDMTIIILEEMGKWMEARALIKELLGSGTITDLWEIGFLKERLAVIERAMEGVMEGMVEKETVE